ncbi:hypothetical protein BD626DRAFT_459544 [Schizophyllum amplum]|uniref:MARVEL domain-containing protein n=1 Tax=Schizophyllum amplum TaxID=97359 RepID=A0A550CAR6_9AGAR|nr:hypothetical protein BD626DRAFT_459544 [Auriculariopsis ampla]
MANLLLTLRYVAFVVFIICNAIIASVAAWNLSLAQTVGFGSVAQIDPYMIFVAASALIIIFTIIFRELAVATSIFGSVSSECVWVMLYWILELVGAAAFSAIGHSMCDSDDLRFMNQPSSIARDSCASSRVLMGFSWICTLTLMAYLVALVTSTISHYHEDPQAWHCKIKDYPWASGQPLGDAPTRTATPSSIEKAAPPAAAPQQRWAPPLAAVLSRSSATASPESIINPFPLPATSQKPIPSIPAQRAPDASQETYHRPPSNPSLYSRAVQSSMPRASPQPTYYNPNRPPSPPRDWQRSEIVSQSQRNMQSPATVPAGSAASSTSSRGSRRVEGHRPPPLDLSKISAFRQK